MGSFSRTCGISNTAISEDESVVIIVFTKECRKEFQLSELIQHTYRHYKIIKGEDLRNGLPESYNYPIDRIIHGDYDDYGWIDGDDTEPEYKFESMRHLVFHTWAVECALGKKISDIELNIKTAIEILDYCYWIRRSPLDRLLGNQFPDLQELKAQLTLNEATSEYLIKKIEGYPTYEDDED